MASAGSNCAGTEEDEEDNGGDSYNVGGALALAAVAAAMAEMVEVFRKRRAAMRLGTVADVAAATRKDDGDGLDLRFAAAVFPSIRRHWFRPSLLLLRVLLSVRLTTMVLVFWARSLGAVMRVRRWLALLSGETVERAGFKVAIIASFRRLLLDSFAASSRLVFRRFFGRRTEVIRS
nr:hypothetical protein Iba_chr04dCG13110 [Ipomoea batatas]